MLIKKLPIIATIILTSSFAISTGAFAACAPARAAVPLSLVDENTYPASEGLNVGSGMNCAVKTKLDTAATTQPLTNAPRAPIAHSNATPTSLFD